MLATQRQTCQERAWSAEDQFGSTRCGWRASVGLVHSRLEPVTIGWLRQSPDGPAATYRTPPLRDRWQTLLLLQCLIPLACLLNVLSDCSPRPFSGLVAELPLCQMHLRHYLPPHQAELL